MHHKQDLHDRIDELASLEGEGTQLVSLAIPPEKSIRTIRSRIVDEHAAAANIKDDRTRDNVQTALDRLYAELQAYQETPESGLAVYVGVVDGDLTVATFDDLPTSVATSLYRCDSEFDLGPLQAAAQPEDSYGLLVIERGAATLGRLAGDAIIPINSIESQVMGKSRAGGQSAQRFERERERQLHEFFTVVGKQASRAFIDSDGPIEGLVIGGTMITADQFTDGDYLDHRLKERVLGTYGVEYATKQGLDELVDKARDKIMDESQTAARSALDEFYSRLRNGDRVAYGDDEVRTALSYGAVDVCLIADSTDREQRIELEEAVADQGGQTVIVPTVFDGGQQFDAAFGGVGALLRFPIN